MAEIMEGAEPFRFDSEGGPAVLVLHGFTGSPQSMLYLGEQLNSRFGFSVRGPRLAGHGTSPDDMADTGYLDWLGTAEDALHEMAAEHGKVFVTGLSMGEPFVSIWLHGFLTSSPASFLSMVVAAGWDQRCRSLCSIAMPLTAFPASARTSRRKGSSNSLMRRFQPIVCDRPMH